MKTLIAPRDIRKGDLIRFEYADGRSTDRAKEYVASGDGVGDGRGPVGTYYLLDRPVPPVDLPTEPTLGWLTLPGGRALETVWTSNDKASLHRALGGSVDVANVTAFTPATAVPTAALDELRKHTPGWSTASVTTFLAAVDEANGKSA